MTSEKGLAGTVERAVLLPFRYGFDGTRIGTRLQQMASLASRWDITPCLPLTACNLDYHRDLSADLDEFELAIHGYRHVAYAGLSKGQQTTDLQAAVQTFSRFGLNASGFRSPYLSANETTFSILRDRGFAFDSSVPRFMLARDHPIAADALELAERRYGSQIRDGNQLSVESGLVELPVAIPDDEILVDGLRIRSSAVLARILAAMLESARTAESILVVQVHPERFHIMASALDAMLRRASDLDAWKVSLHEAARWIARRNPMGSPWPHGHPFAVCLTGDLDAVTLADFVRRMRGT